MAKLDRLRVQVRVSGRDSSNQSVYVGAFAAWLPQVPAIGWVLDATLLDEVDWAEPTNESFKKLVASKQVTAGDTLVVEKVGLVLDDEGSCDAVWVDVAIA